MSHFLVQSNDHDRIVYLEVPAILTPHTMTMNCALPTEEKEEEEELQSPGEARVNRVYVGKTSLAMSSLPTHTSGRSQWTAPTSMSGFLSAFSQ